MTIKAEIIAQCWSLFYRWTIDPSDDLFAQTQNQLFRLLEDLDYEAHAEVFAAALNKQDFPAAVSRRYPVKKGEDA